MADQQILREYLLSLGFKTNSVDVKKFDDVLTGIDKSVMKLGKGLIGLAAGTAAAVAMFGNSMEKLYYASQRSGASAANLDAFEYAAKQVGVSTEAMEASITSLGTTIRSQPGIQQYIENLLGHSIKDEDVADTWLELMTKLKPLMEQGPAGVSKANSIANLLGIDPDTLFMVTKHLSDFKAAVQEEKNRQKEDGVDLDAAAKSGVEYAKALGRIKAEAMMLRNAIGVQLLPKFTEFSGVVTEVLKDWTHLVMQEPPKNGWLDKLLAGLGLVSHKTDAEHKADDAPKGWFHRIFIPWRLWDFASDVVDRLNNKVTMNNDARHRYVMAVKNGLIKPGPLRYETPPAASKAWEATDGYKREFMASLDRLYGLPAGHLAKQYQAESNSGDPRFMVSPAGAKGPFQFMDATAKEWGVTDPFDFKQEAAGAARFMQHLMRKYGDYQEALAAYNWGEGNLDKYLAGKIHEIPKETLGYVQEISGQPVHFQQETNIHVHGSEPRSTAAAVAEQQANVAADMIRAAGVL